MSDRDDLIPRLAEAIHAVDDAGCAELPDGGQCETCTARAVAALRVVRCDGSERCTATPHVHGCLYDDGDCDDPTDHDMDTSVAPSPSDDVIEPSPAELGYVCHAPGPCGYDDEGRPMIHTEPEE